MLDRRETFDLINQLDFEPVQPGRVSGQFDFGRFQLSLPETAAAGWTTMGIRLPQIAAGFPPELFGTPARRTALEDAALRRMAAAAAAWPKHLRVPEPSSQIVPRSTINISSETAQATIMVRLVPEGDDAYSAEHLHTLFAEAIPAVISNSLFHCNHDEHSLNVAVASMHNLVQLRKALSGSGLVAFLGEGAGLPGGKPLRADDSLTGTLKAGDLNLPGVGIPAGLTVLIGDRYSGRHELMRSIAHGVYNRPHRDPGERIITSPDAVLVCAEPGRAVNSVDLRPFLRERPGVPVERFTTDNADEISSQAAGVLEAIEAGSRVLLFDEASSSTEFLSGDGGLLARPQVIPLVSQVDSLVRQGGVSIVVAGSGAAMAPFIAKANKVLSIVDGYLSDVTATAKERVGSMPVATPEFPAHAAMDQKRWIVPFSIDASWAQEETSVTASGAELTFGGDVIDLGGVPQITDETQLETIGHALAYARRRMLENGHHVRSLLDGIDETMSSNEGLALISLGASPRLARPRRYETAAVLNRLPSLRISQIG